MTEIKTAIKRYEGIDKYSILFCVDHGAIYIYIYVYVYIYIRTCVAGMIPLAEQAWYLLSSAEDPLARRMPSAAEWWEMSIMKGNGQRLGTKTPGSPFVSSLRASPHLVCFDGHCFGVLGV